MFDLSTINFKVNTAEIAEGIDKLRDLKQATEATSAAQSRAAQAASKAAEAQSKAETAAEKAAQARLKTTEAIERAEVSKANAAKQSAKVAVDANESVATAVDKTEKAIQRQELAIGFMAEGFSRAQANQLAFHKQSGATQDQLDRLGNSARELRTLMGTDTFDNSLGAMQKMRTEAKLLNDANEMYKRGINLTTRELTELAREKQRVTTLMQKEGATDRELAASLGQLENAYEEVAKARNAFAGNINASNKAMEQQKKALSGVEAEMERVVHANQELNASLTTSSSNGILRFQKMLEKSGLTAEEQIKRLAAYRAEVEKLNATKGTSTGSGQDYGYVQRAIGPQVTDIVVGLTTGQGLMTVMLQQGGQLRDQFGMAGVAAKDMAGMIRTATMEMVTTMAQVGKAIATAIVGGFYDASKAAVMFMGNMTGIAGVVSNTTTALNGMGTAGRVAAAGIAALGTAFTVLVGVTGLAAIASLIALAKGFYDATKESDNFAKAMSNSSAAFQATHTEAISLAKTMGDMSGNTSQYISLLGEMSQAGNLAAADIKIFGQTGVEQMKWLGMTAEEVVKQYSEMAKDPVKALTELASRTGMVKIETIAYVAELVKQGDKAGATALAMSELSRVNGDAVEQMKKDYSGFAVAIKTLAAGIANFFNQVFKDLWYKANPEDKLNQAIKETEDRIAALEKGGGFTYNRRAEAQQLRAKLVDMQHEASMLNLTNNMKKEQQELDSNLATLSGEIAANEAKYATKVEKKQKELQDATRTRMKQEEEMGKIVDKNSQTYLTASENLIKAKRHEKNAQAELNDEIAKEAKKGSKAAKDTRDSATSSVGQVNDNMLKELNTQYNMRLAAAKEYGNAEQQILKAQYDAGIIKQAEYAYRSNALSAEREAKELDIIQEGRGKINAEYQKDVANLNAAYDQQIKANEGLKNSEEANIELNKKRTIALENLKNRYDTLTASMDKNAATAQTGAEVRKIQVNAQLEAGVIKLQKAWDDLTISEENLAKQREADMKTRDALRLATPAEAAAIKAAAAETKRWEQIIAQFQKTVIDAKKKLDELLAKPPALDASQATQEAYKAAVKAATNEWEKAMQNVNQANAKQRTDVENRASEAIVDFYKDKYDEFNDQLANSLTEMIFSGGKSGADQLKAYLKKTFLMEPFTILLKGVLQSVTGGVFNLLMGGADAIMGGGSGSGSGFLGMASNANTAYGVGSAIYGGYAGNYFLNGTAGTIAEGMGLGNLSTAVGNYLNWGTTTPTLNTILGIGGEGATAGAAGQGFNIGGMGGAGMAMMIPFIVAYLAGMFGDEKQVGQGLTGELGGDIYGYQLMRESGSLFKGPKYRTLIAEQKMKELDAQIEAVRNDPKYNQYGERGEAARKQKLDELYKNRKYYEDTYGAQVEGSKGPISAMQKAYSAMREDTAKRAEILGLDGDKIRNMKVSLNMDTIHNDTGGKGLEFTDLSDEDIGKKIGLALTNANEELARAVLTDWTEVTHEVTKWVGKQVIREVGDGGWVTDTEWTQVTETVTEMVQVNSQYIREGETALQALTRLSDSLVSVNATFDVLGVNLLEGSLASADLASKFIDLFGGMDKFTSAMDTYYQAFYSETERMDRASSDMQKQLKEKGIDLDITGIVGKAQRGELSADEIEKFRKEVRDMVTSLLNDGTEESQKLAAFLIQIAGNLDGLLKYADNADKNAKAKADADKKAAEDKKKAEEDAAKKAADELKKTLETALRDAYAVLEKSINAQLEVLNKDLKDRQDSLKTLESIKNLLTKNVKDLYNQVDDTKKMLQDQGRQYIQGLLNGSATMDQDKLSEAITSVRQGLDEGFYASKFEEEMARLVFANELSKLQDQTDTQISAEKKQIAAIESQIEYLKGVLETAKLQLDTALGLNVAVMGVEAAINNFNVALMNYLGNKGGTAPTTPGSGNGGNTYPGGGDLGGSKPGGPGGGNSNRVTVIGYDAEGRAYYSDGSVGKAKAGENIYNDTGNVTASGITMEQWEKLKKGEDAFGGYWMNGQYQSNGRYKWDDGKQMYVPAFAAGGAYGGGLALVGEEGPELINFGQSGTVHTAAETSAILSGSSAPATKEDMDMMNRAIISVAKSTMQTKNLLDRVIKDGNSITVTIAP